MCTVFVSICCVNIWSCATHMHDIHPSQTHTHHITHTPHHTHTSHCIPPVPSQFYARPDTFSLGVCNGCQLMALLGWVPGVDAQGQQGRLPDTEQPRFIHNNSGRFESRWVTVAIDESPAIMLQVCGEGGGGGGLRISLYFCPSLTHTNFINKTKNTNNSLTHKQTPHTHTHTTQHTGNGWFSCWYMVCPW